MISLWNVLRLYGWAVLLFVRNHSAQANQCHHHYLCSCIILNFDSISLLFCGFLFANFHQNSISSTAMFLRWIKGWSFNVTVYFLYVSKCKRKEMSCSWNKRSVQFAFNWNAYGFCSRVWEMPHLLWLRFKGFGCFCSLCGSNWNCPIFTRITNQWNLVSRASRCHWAMHLRYHYVKKGSICRFDLAILCFVCVCTIREPWCGEMGTDETGVIGLALFEWLRSK